MTFLLGGHDLEMTEIKNLLQQSNQLFHDRKLSWGAKLSDYADVFNDQTHFVGIELLEDIAPPKHYTRIDHHGDIDHLLRTRITGNRFLVRRGRLVRRGKVGSCHGDAHAEREQHESIGDGDDQTRIDTAIARDVHADQDIGHGRPDHR